MVMEVIALSKTIKGVDVLKDINVRLESGNIYGVVGRNGSGKTMFLRALAGLIVPTTGEINPPDDYISILLSKMRARIATLSYFERQENKTLELQRAFNMSPPERYKNAVSFLRMLFDSPAKNMQKMADVLTKHEKRYAFNNRTTYFDHPHIYLWELKAYAYDYYFFFKKNGVPLDYFSEPKEYFSYYLKALLCSYSPQKKTRISWASELIQRNVIIQLAKWIWICS